MREFGPAAFEDLIPRLRALAADLDAAHAAGFIHGRLHPSKVLVTGDGTYLLGARVPQSVDLSTSLASSDTRRWPIQPPYTAPEIMEGAPPAPTSDQFALAAIAYEWMFGRPISGPAERTVDVRTIPNVDRGALAKAFTRALAPESFRRFASCADFCDAIAWSMTPSLPLTPPQHGGTPVPGTPAAYDDDDPVGPFQPEEPSPTPIAPIAAATTAPDLVLSRDAADRDDDEPPLVAASAVAASDRETYASHESRSPRFGGFALILAAIVGAVFGFAAGYMARPRALQSGPPAELAAAGADNDLAPTSAAPAPAPKKSEAPKAPEAPTRIGRLLVRSTPSGAGVEVDGVARGVTPLALRDLDLGARDITVSRRGYAPEERRIVLTKARPSRSVEVRLSQQAAATPRPATPGSLGKPAVSTGALAIESRPTGAAVAVNGKPSGTTPLTINDLPPGDYRVTMTLDGHQPFATTVRVVAGERARAAARLTEQEQE